MNIGFIGIGNLGITIARDLARSSHGLIVYDVRQGAVEELRALGAAVATSPADVARQVDVVGVCVSSDEQVVDALMGTDGVFAAARPGLVVAIHSTIHTDTLDKVRAAAETLNVRLVDAPVCRGTNAPKTKATVFMLGGEAEAVEIAADYVKPAALAIIRTGGSGSGLMLKICNNALTYMNVIVLRDIEHLAKNAGVDLRSLRELVCANGGASPAMLYYIDQRTDGPSTSNHVIASAEASVALAEKDLSAALELARATGAKVPAIAFGREHIRQAVLGS